MVLGANAAGYFLLRSKDNDFSRELILERYKSNLALDLGKDLWQPPGSYIEKVFLQQSGIVAFGIVRNNVLDKYDFMCWKTDDQLNASGTPQKLFQVDAGALKSKSGFYIKQSPDKSKFYFMYLLKAKGGESSILAVHSMTAEFAPIYTRYYPIEQPVDDVYITAFECDDDDNAFVLIDYPASATRKKSELHRRFFVYVVSGKQEDITEFELSGDSMEIADLGLTVNTYGKCATVAGFYRNNPGENSIQGFFYYNIDIPSMKFKVKQKTGFEKSLVHKINSVLTGDQNAGLSDLMIRKLIPRSDGGCMILAEKYYETKQTYTYYVNGFQQTSSRTVYNFDEIVLFSINAEGTIQFNEVVKKRQSSVNDGGYYSSFVTLNNNSSIALIYSMDASAESDVMVTTITPTGEMDTRILIKAMSYYVSLMPPESKQVSSNSVLICSMKDRKFSIMKVTY